MQVLYPCTLAEAKALNQGKLKVKPATDELNKALLCLPVHLANPLGILVTNVLSPALVKKAEDIPMMVRGL